MDNEKTITTEVAISELSEQSESDLPVDIRTAAEAARLLDQGEQRISMWLPVICPRLEARNAPKTKGLSAKRMYCESAQMEQNFKANGIECWGDVSPGLMSDFLESAWVDRYGNPQRPAKERMDSRWKVARAVFEEAAALGVVFDSDVLEQDIVYRESDIPPRRVMTEDEANTVREVINATSLGTAKSICFALMFSGATSTEASKVRKRDIDLQARTVALRGKAPRLNPIDPWAANAIELYLKINPALEDDALLCVTRLRESTGHKGPDNIYVYLQVKMGLREAGFHRLKTGITSESLRLTGAQRILESSGIVAAARFLGYKSLDTTARVLEYKWNVPQAEISTTTESCNSHG